MKILDFLLAGAEKFAVLLPGPIGKAAGLLLPLFANQQQSAGVTTFLGSAEAMIGELQHILSGWQALQAGGDWVAEAKFAVKELYTLAPNFLPIPETAVDQLIDLYATGLSVVWQHREVAANPQMPLPPPLVAIPVTAAPSVVVAQVQKKVQEQPHVPQKPTPMPEAGSVPVQSVTPSLPPVDPTSTEDQGRGF